MSLHDRIVKLKAAAASPTGAAMFVRKAVASGIGAAEKAAKQNRWVSTNVHTPLFFDALIRQANQVLAPFDLRIDPSGSKGASTMGAALQLYRKVAAGWKHMDVSIRIGIQHGDGGLETSGMTVHAGQSGPRMLGVRLPSRRPLKTLATMA